MTKKTSIIFTIFFIVAFVGVFFIYFYRIQIDNLVNKYISKITVCENILDENECFTKDFCEGIYVPSCPECQDLEFKRCQRMPVKIAIEFENEKTICANSGGEWYRNKLGNFCLCQNAGAGKIFDKDKGCITQ